MHCPPFRTGPYFVPIMGLISWAELKFTNLPAIIESWCFLNWKVLVSNIVIWRCGKKNKWNYSLVILNFINKSCKNEKRTLYMYKLPTKIKFKKNLIPRLHCYPCHPPPPFPSPFSLPIDNNNRQFFPWLYHSNTLCNILVNLTFFVCVIWLTACFPRKDNYCEIPHCVKCAKRRQFSMNEQLLLTHAMVSRRIQIQFKGSYALGTRLYIYQT